MGFSLRSQVSVSELAAGGAILACFAVVLGVVNFSKETRDVARSQAAQTFVQVVTQIPAVDAAVPQPLSLAMSEPQQQRDSRPAPVASAIVPVTNTSEAARVEPAPIEEPAHVESAYIQPAQVQPAQVQPAQIEAARVEPARAEVAEAVSASGVIPATAANTEALILGIWAPDGSSCSLREFRQGMLPTIINAEGAWAGETFCAFKNHQQTDNGWRVVADCSNAAQHWTTQVRLSVKGDRLTWASKRGTQVYTRCGQDVHMARAAR